MTNPFWKRVGPYCIALVRFPAETGWAWVVGSQQDPCARRVAWEAPPPETGRSARTFPGPYAGRDFGENGSAIGLCSIASPAERSRCGPPTPRFESRRAQPQRRGRPSGPNFMNSTTRFSRCS